MATSGASEKPSIGMIPAYKRYVMTWLWPHRRLFFWALVITILLALSTGAFAKVTQLIVIALNTPQESVFPLWVAPFLVAGLALLRGTLSYLRLMLINYTTTAAALDLKLDLYGKFIRADLAQLSSEASTSSATRFNVDVSLANNSIVHLLSLFSMVSIMFSTLGFMLWINWQLTIAFIFILGLGVLPILDLGQRMRRISVRNQRQIGVATSKVSESLSSIRLIRTYGIEAQSQKDTKAAFEEIRRLSLKQVSVVARITPITEFLGGLAIAVLLGAIIIIFGDNENIIADFVGLLAGMGVIAPEFQRSGKLYTRVQQGTAAMERVYDILDRDAEIVSPPNAPSLGRALGKVSFENVGFEYPDGTKALSDISFEASPGEMIAFVGRSGAGKSTIFNLLPRLYDVTHGAVKIDGHDIRDVQLGSLRKNLALVSQDSLLLSGTVAENLRAGWTDATDADVIAAAKAASADTFISELPEGYETTITAETHGFSGGQRQRLSIARAMLRDAPILLLDEPTSALDAESEAIVRSSLDTLSEGRTTLVIAHRLATILSADQILVLDQGQVVERGTHSTLLQQDGLYAQLYKMQFDEAQAKAQ